MLINISFLKRFWRMEPLFCKTWPRPLPVCTRVLQLMRWLQYTICSVAVCYQNYQMIHRIAFRTFLVKNNTCYFSTSSSIQSVFIFSLCFLIENKHSLKKIIIVLSGRLGVSCHGQLSSPSLSGGRNQGLLIGKHNSYCIQGGRNQGLLTGKQNSY